MSSTWLANESPDGTPTSSADYAVRLVRHGGALRAFETCPRCSQDDALSLEDLDQDGGMACGVCNRRWGLPDSPAAHEAARGERIA